LPAEGVIEHRYEQSEVDNTAIPHLSDNRGQIDLKPCRKHFRWNGVRRLAIYWQTAYFNIGIILLKFGEG
jgi:hypothetical protein